MLSRDSFFGERKISLNTKGSYEIFVCCCNETMNADMLDSICYVTIFFLLKSKTEKVRISIEILRIVDFIIIEKFAVRNNYIYFDFFFAFV